jgi:hypothetical protein
MSVFAQRKTRTKAGSSPAAGKLGSDSFAEQREFRYGSILAKLRLKIDKGKLAAESVVSYFNSSFRELDRLVSACLSFICACVCHLWIAGFWLGFSRLKTSQSRLLVARRALSLNEEGKTNSLFMC